MKLTNETKIGVLVAGVLVVLAVLTWKTGNYSFIPNGYEIKIRFLDVQGLAKNAPVTLNGFEEGRVQGVKIIYGDVPEVELTLWLKAEAKIFKNAKAHIRMMGFMGEKYVAIEMHDNKEGFLPPGSVIQGQEPSSFEKLMDEGQVIAKNLREISQEIDEHLAKNKDAIDDIIADLRVTSKNLRFITTNVNDRLANNSKLIDEMVGNLDSTSKNLDEMSYDLKVNPWKLLYKPSREHKVPWNR